MERDARKNERGKEEREARGGKKRSEGRSC